MEEAKSEPANFAAPVIKAEEDEDRCKMHCCKLFTKDRRVQWKVKDYISIYIYIIRLVVEYFFEFSKTCSCKVVGSLLTLLLNFLKTES